MQIDYTVLTVWRWTDDDEFSHSGTKRTECCNKEIALWESKFHHPLVFENSLERRTIFRKEGMGKARGTLESLLFTLLFRCLLFSSIFFNLIYFYLAYLDYRLKQAFWIFIWDFLKPGCAGFLFLLLFGFGRLFLLLIGQPHLLC